MLATTESSVAHERAGRAQQACVCNWDASTTKLRTRQGNPVTKEKFSVAAGAWRQRPRHAHNKVCAHCDNTLGAHTTGSRYAHDENVCAIEEVYRDRVVQ